MFALDSRDIPGIFFLWLLFCRLYGFLPMHLEKALRHPSLQSFLARSNEKASFFGQGLAMLRDAGLWRHLLDL